MKDQAFGSFLHRFRLAAGAIDGKQNALVGEKLADVSFEGWSRMKNNALVFVAAVFLATGLVAAQDQPVKPDNTKMNDGDARKGTITADQQKMDSGDRHVTQKIRQAVIADKSLSMYGHNVKIISRNGKVTLKGPVRSDEEKKMIAAKAIEITGSADNVDNQLTVQPAN